MKKIMIFLSILLLLLLSSCDDYAQYTLEPKESELALESIDISSTKYIISTNSKTFHLEGCYIVGNIKEENIREIFDRDFLIDRSYTPCKRCNP